MGNACPSYFNIVRDMSACAIIGISDPRHSLGLTVEGGGRSIKGKGRDGFVGSLTNKFFIQKYFLARKKDRFHTATMSLSELAYVAALLGAAGALIGV